MRDGASGTDPRSMLFVPGSRPDMLAKICRFRADVVVVDLEDAVPHGDKAAARRNSVRALPELMANRSGMTLIRVNPVGSPWFLEDLKAASSSGAHGVVVPKLSSAKEVYELRQFAEGLSWTAPVLVAGIETAVAVADAREVLAAGGLSGVYFGAEDYIADIGGFRTSAGTEVLYARSAVCLAAHLAGIWAVDQAVTNFDDDEHFLRDATDGAAIGFTGKICIHPRQVALAHRVFTPSAEEVARAQAIIRGGQTGVAVMDGRMIDDVHLRMARKILDRVSEPPRDGEF